MTGRGAMPLPARAYLNEVKGTMRKVRGKEEFAWKR